MADTFGGVYISTYGCQMNVADSERMYSLLEMHNFHPVETPDQADVIIINSCSVREKPVHKVLSEVGTYRKLKAEKPNLRIGVGGCVGSQEKGKLMEAAPLIDFVFGTDNIETLPELVTKSLAEKGRHVDVQFHHRDPYHIETLIRNPGVATFVNITKGCDNFCSFCVVPFTRGREKSRPLKQIISDLQSLQKRGVKEVTLLGQNVNSYSSDCGADFADLLKTVALETDLLRIRYTTSHPKDFNEKLARVMEDHHEKICEYIHLPFQSGNTRILERMNRGYTREDYLQKIKMIRKHLPRVVFSTDIIVGFPGETESEFRDTVSMVEEVGYETIFAFKYSPRPMTKAAQFQDQVEESVKAERLEILFEAHEKMALKLVKKYEGQELEVLFENYDQKRGNLSGRSTQNKLVYVPGPATLVGQLRTVKIQSAFPSVLRGELVSQVSSEEISSVEIRSEEIGSDTKKSEAKYSEEKSEVEGPSEILSSSVTTNRGLHLSSSEGIRI